MNDTGINTTIICVFCGGERLDVFLCKELDRTRSYLKKLIDSHAVLVNNQPAKCGKILQKNDIITIKEEIVTLDILPEDIPINIIFEDTDIAVINKQRGLTVHPSGGANSGTLVNALLFHLKDLSSIGGTVRPGIVHRLDKDTTGLMVTAKNDLAHLSLSKQIAERSVKKVYQAILEGCPKEDSGRIITNIDRSKTDRKKMAVSQEGREAITDFHVLERFSQNSLVEFTLQTGRTHQIRVHAKHIGCPIVGDLKYGFKKQKFKTTGQLLHSGFLSFVHPRTSEVMEFSAPPPEDFCKVLKILRNKER